ncbi:Pectinesterase [Heracleum sosnowskyi]|uniref:Pectinesterase n=1 Tax=Heracleum sosnowskyi TaxID=360622 RepID=A0AAD8GPN0_9APIA|nr:Pectinesterase [Heracleum sosnowskyi]
MGTYHVAYDAILVTILVFLVPKVVTDDADPVPSDKSLLSTWFAKNVGPASGRTGLDPALAIAESRPPKIIYVKQDGSGDFKTIGDAIKSVPRLNPYRIIISIAGGNYVEKLLVDHYQTFVTLYGDPNDIPVISFNGDAWTYGTTHSGTLTVEATADYFMAVNLKIVNTTPRPDGRLMAQALAMRVSGKNGAYYNVEMHGFQDTLCDDAGHHLFKDCYIQGTVDFIFGNSKSLYLNTELHVLEGTTQADVITAHANDDPNADLGFSFVHCSVTGNSTKTYLGRTWRSHPKVIFSYTQMGHVVHPLGWSSLSRPNYAKTAYFAEFKNRGPGAAPDQRASYVKKLSDADAKPFITLSHINASTWLLPPPKL